MDIFFAVGRRVDSTLHLLRGLLSLRILEHITITMQRRNPKRKGRKKRSSSSAAAATSTVSTAAMSTSQTTTQTTSTTNEVAPPFNIDFGSMDQTLLISSKPPAVGGNGSFIPSSDKGTSVHNDNFSSILYEHRLAITIGDADKGSEQKTMTFYANYDFKEGTYDSKVVLKVMNGTIIGMPKAVAGVLPTICGKTISHEASHIAQSICYGIHTEQREEMYRGVENDIEELNGGEEEHPLSLKHAKEDLAYHKDRIVNLDEDGSEDLLLVLLQHGLMIQQYTFDNAQLSEDLHNIIKVDKLFVENHHEKKNKIAWWSTGGPDFSESIERTLGQYKSFTDLWGWMKEHGWEDYKLPGQFMAYYDPNAHFE